MKRSTGNDLLKLLNRVIQTAFVVDPIKFKLANCESTNTIKEVVWVFDREGGLICKFFASGKNRKDEK